MTATIVSFPFRDPALSITARVEDLLGRLSVDEKMKMLHYQSPAVERLGVPAYNWWNEALHGVARNGRATVFPQAIALAAGFDRDLALRVYRAIAAEARAKYAASALQGKRGQYRGLTFWTPNINIFRDPRWGRGQETYGECPYLTAELGVIAVRGLQGDHPEQRLVAAACAKHFVVHSGPERDRHVFDARPTVQDFYETYTPAFQALVEAGVESVMGAYNRIYGQPCNGSPFLLQTLLRDTWGYTGHVVSDCWALRDFHQFHKVTADARESAALALKSGCDLNCGCVYEELPQTLEAGLITEADLDGALRRLLSCRVRLGHFDETEADLKRMAQSVVVGGPEHRALALEAAQKGTVLLKNDGVLPLRRDGIDIFVCGPHATSAEVLLGNYCGVNARLTTIVEGMAAAAATSANIFYKPGVLSDQPSRNGIDWTTGEARSSDVIIAVCGLDPRLENEEGDAIASATMGDREDIGLPPWQQAWLMKLTDKSQQPKPVVLILTGGSAIALGELAERCAAVLTCWYPGEAGGEAVAEILFGGVNPSGRLPVTVPRGTAQLPAFDDYRMDGRTYRFLHEDPLYPFGYGLSYTTYAYSGLGLPAAPVRAGDGFQVSAVVANTGARAGEEVVQCYVSLPGRSARTPWAQLVGFQRVALAAGQSREVSFTIRAEQLAVVREHGQRVAEAGPVLVEVGGCSPGPRGRALGAAQPVRGEVRLVGEHAWPVPPQPPA